MKKRSAGLAWRYGAVVVVIVAILAALAMVSLDQRLFHERQSSSLRDVRVHKPQPKRVLPGARMAHRRSYWQPTTEAPNGPA